MSGKGSGRRKENSKRVEKNLKQMKWGERDKAKDDFKITVNGKKK